MNIYMQECQFVKRGATLEALEADNEFRSIIKILSSVNMLCIFVTLIRNVYSILLWHFKILPQLLTTSIFKPLPTATCFEKPN